VTPRGQTVRRQRDPRVRRFLGAWLVLATVLVGLAVAVVAVRAREFDLGYRLARLRLEIRTAEELNRQLRMEQTMLSSPTRIERAATALGLTAPIPGQVRIAREFVTAGPGVASSHVAQTPAPSGARLR
jgi:cell division protein FtsL